MTMSRYFPRGWAAAALLLVADQVSKWWIFERVLRRADVVPGMGFGEWLQSRQPAADFLAQYGTVYQDVVLAPFLNIVMVWNRGVSFGLMASDTAAGRACLIGLAVVIVTVLSALLWRAARLRLAAGLVLVIGGAVGNIFDRLRFGAVADFVDLHVAGYHWPAFNIADMSIVFGALLLILDAAILKEDTPKTDGGSPSP